MTDNSKRAPNILMYAPRLLQLLEKAALAPARGYLAQSPQADFGGGRLGNALTQAHKAIDPVNAMGGYGGLLAMALPPGGAAAKVSGMKSYPLAPRGEWWGDGTFEATGGKMVKMSPDEFLKKSRPLKIDETSRENINELKQHMQDGKTLDPLAIYKNGKEDGRHRAIAAKELGISEVPVLVWP